MTGILFDTSFDIALSIKKDSNGLITTGLAVGNTLAQNAVIVLNMSPGDLKEDPVLGAGLTKYIRGTYSASAIESRMKAHLSRAGINYTDIKKELATTIATEE